MVAGKIVAAALSAVPASEIACGLPVASSCIVTEAVRLPADTGANDTLITQLAPALSAGGQLLICTKLLLSGPVMERLVIVRVALPTFESVTFLRGACRSHGLIRESKARRGERNARSDSGAGKRYLLGARFGTEPNSPIPGLRAALSQTL